MNEQITSLQNRIARLELLASTRPINAAQAAFEAEIDDWQRIADDTEKILWDTEKENERLRAVLTLALDFLKDAEEPTDEWMAESRRLIASKK